MSTSILGPSSYKAKRYAVKYDPPCIYLEYEDVENNRRVRVVKLNNIESTSDPDRLTRKVIRSFPRRIDPASVKYEQVKNLICRLIQHTVENVPAPNSASKPSNTNKASAFQSVQNNARSRLESTSFRATEFEAAGVASAVSSSNPQAAGPGISKTEDDSLSAMLEELERDLDDSSTKLKEQKPLSASVQGISAASRSATKLLSEGLEESTDDRLVLDMEISGDLDLNRVTEIELKLAKKKMDEDFHKNQIKPDDPQYEYDKQVEFAEPTEDNEWDDDD